MLNEYVVKTKWNNLCEKPFQTVKLDGIVSSYYSRLKRGLSPSETGISELALYRQKKANPK